MRIRPCRLYRRLYRSQCSTRCARPDSPPTANGFDPLHGRGGWKRPLPALRGNANGRPEHRPRKTESDYVNLGTFFSRLRGRTHPPPPARPHPGKPNRTTLNTRKPDMTPQRGPCGRDVTVARKVSKPTAAIEYPTWKVRGAPTPNERLVICDECGNAAWVGHGDFVHTCFNRHQHANKSYRRMRNATPAETETAKTYLKEVIG